MSPVHDLKQLPIAFADYFSAGDLDGLLALNAPDAVFVPSPGEAVTGADNVRAALEQFLALTLPITMTVRHAFTSGSTGLVVADWTISGTGPDGSHVALAGTTADVAVFDEIAGWRYLIDNPFGTL